MPANPTVAPEGLPKPETLLRGVVTSINRKARTYQVQARESEVNLEGCRWAAGSVFSPLFGFNANGLLEEGTEVLVLQGNPPYIIKTLPSQPGDQGGRADGRTVGSGILAASITGDADSPETNVGDDVPGDMVEGEHSINNAMGVGIDFLTTLMRLHAGRAFVEACVLEDTVRIVARHFKLHTAIGDEVHGDDGRLDARQSATSYPHEAWGKLTPEQARLQFGAQGTPKPITDTELTQTGRWRYERFLGFLGDFIHQWVATPETILGDIAQQGVRSGMSHHWAGADGTLLWQSVSEIALERVVRIVVPRSKVGDRAKPDDAYYKALEASYLRIWDRGVDIHRAHQTAFQIREYARWLSQFMGLARFHQQSARYTVPSESATPAPEWTAGEADREAANGGAVPAYATYATIRIMRDGGIMALEGGGGCLLLTGGRGFISVPYDMNFESGGDMRFTCGRDMWIKSRRHMTLSSTFGGLALKSRAFFRVLCERGSIWIKSDADHTAPSEGTADNPAAEKQSAAILLEASRGSATVTAMQQVLIDSQGPAEVKATPPGGVVLQAGRGDVVVTAKRTLSLGGERSIQLNSVGALLLRVGRVWGDLMSQQFSIKGLFSISGGVLNVGRVVTGSVSSVGGYVGPNDKVSRSDDITEPNPANDLTLPDAYPPTNTAFFAVPSDRVPWRFPEVRVPAAHPIMETLSQQHVATEPAVEGITLGTWNSSTDKLQTAPGTDSNSLPFPGAEQQLVHRPGKRLHAPSATAPSAITPPTPLTAQAPSVKFLSDQ